MDNRQKVLWSEGMFLTPHHFQQGDRYVENLVRERMRSVQAFDWGLCSLNINEDALANGELIVGTILGVLPDGLTVNAPDIDPVPPSRTVETAFDSKKSKLDVYLASPLVRAGTPATSDDGEADGRPTRYRKGQTTVTDEYFGGKDNEVQVAGKNLRILFEGEPLDDFVTMKIAELGRTATGTFQLNPNFVPPCLYISASPWLMGMLKRTLEILSTKSSDLSGQRRQRSAGLVEFTMSEASSFWLLHTANAYIPSLAHYFNNPRIHPEHLYLHLARMAGELYTFSADGHPKDVPLYVHDNPANTFTILAEKIQEMLGTVIASRCTPIPLEKARDSLYTGMLRDDRIIDEAQLYLAVRANVPEEKIIKEVPIKSKISSRDRVDSLIAAALRGLAIRHLPTPPSEIPVQPGRQYFQIDKAGDQWEAVKTSKTIAFYIPPEFTDVKLELMAVKG